jgi:hypothetical protein
VEFFVSSSCQPFKIMPKVTNNSKIEVTSSSQKSPSQTKYKTPSKLKFGYGKISPLGLITCYRDLRAILDAQLL